MADERLKFMVEDARLIWKNFNGNPTPFNAEGGKRTFNVVLDKQTADAMAADGWNVRCKPSGVPSDEDDEEAAAEEFCYIEVAVGYKIRPPKIVIITESGRTSLREENVGMLDFAEIKTVDLIAQASNWDVNGKQGIKAYLQSMFVTIDEDPLERKYGIQEGE